MNENEDFSDSRLRNRRKEGIFIYVDCYKDEPRQKKFFQIKAINQNSVTRFL